MAHLIQVPAFAPADPANVTGAEWTAFQNAADFADGQLHVGMALLPGPAYNHPAMPQSYLNNPGNPTVRLAAAATTITHLNGLIIHLMTAHHTAALTLAQAQAQVGGQQAPPPAAPPPAAPRIKATTPTKFGGKTLHARTFIAECDNYYALVLMTDKQRIRFALHVTFRVISFYFPIHFHSFSFISVHPFICSYSPYILRSRTPTFSFSFPRTLVLRLGPRSYHVP